MSWTGRADEAAALGLLVDRTYTEAAAAAARPRSLDRDFLLGQFDLWDNHLLPAVAAGTAPPWTRRSAARAVWRRLGLAAGADHRAWMAGHLDDLGHDPAALLGPEPDLGHGPAALLGPEPDLGHGPAALLGPEPDLGHGPAALLGPEPDLGPFRSRDGRPVPVSQPLTAESAELIRAGYDLAGGTLTGARIDLHGRDPQRIGGSLTLRAGSRRYPADDAPPPELHFRVGDATSCVFPHSEPGSARLTGQPTVVTTPEGVSLDVPAACSALRLAGRDLSWFPDDPCWSGSAAARATVAGTADEAPELPELAARGAGVLGILQLAIMWQLRRMRSAGLLRRWELGAAGALCGGLNAELFRVAPAALRARWAARRVSTLLATQDNQAHALLRLVGPHLPLDVPGLPGAAAPPAPARITVGTAGRLVQGVDFTDGRLRLVDVAADRTVIHLDARSGDRDTIVVVVLSEPLGCAPLAVTPAGLALVRRPALDATADDVTLTLPLPGGDWTVGAAAGSWYVD